MSIENLAKVIPPPEEPDEVGNNGELREIEKTLGFTLPADFRELTLRYGSGYFTNDLHFWNPFVDDLRDEGYQAFAVSLFAGKEVIWPAFPARPGLMSISCDSNGHEVFYLTEGEPESWPIIVIPHVGPDAMERWEMPLGDFLAEAFLNQIMTWAVHPNKDAPIAPEERVFTRVGDIWPERREKWRTRRRT
jgi:hypothetical protein